MKNLEVVILGASGSGKTVYLASMNHKLSIPNRERGFYLSLAPDQHKLLNAKFTALLGGDWPLPAQRAEISEWIFTCNIQTPDYKTFPAFTFTYYDYAGERLNDNVDEKQENILTKAIKNADALLGIIDGHKIYAMMTGTPPPGSPLTQDLSNILPDMARTDKPVHLLITKWDILEKQFTLGAVRDRLTAYGQFADFVENRKNHHHPARLIPISSVGHAFADLQSNGEMALRPGVDPRPFQIEIPIACIIPDYLRSIVEQKAADLVHSISGQPSSEMKFRVGESVKRLFISIIRGADTYVEKFVPKQYKFAGSTLVSIAQSVADTWESDIRQREEYLQQKVAELRRQRDMEIAQVKDQETAAKQALVCFERLMYELDSAFPDSNLAK